MSIPTAFEWNDAKAKSNLAKYRISFAVAATVLLDPHHVGEGATRTEDGKSRQKVVGAIEERLFTVVFVRRGEVCRMISARRANAREDEV